MKITVKIDGEAFEVEVGDLYERPVSAVIGEDIYEVWPEGEEPFRVKQPARLEKAAPAVKTHTSIGISPELVQAPIPGTIFLMKVQPGDRVEKGQDLCVLEAMKMKNLIRSPRGGVIQAVRVTNGEQVAAGDVLVVFEP